MLLTSEWTGGLLGEDQGFTEHPEHASEKEKNPLKNKSYEFVQLF